MNTISDYPFGILFNSLFNWFFSLLHPRFFVYCCCAIFYNLLYLMLLKSPSPFAIFHLLPPTLFLCDSRSLTPFVLCCQPSPETVLSLLFSLATHRGCAAVIVLDSS